MWVVLEKLPQKTSTLPTLKIKINEKKGNKTSKRKPRNNP
jgi:hypothetical protein